MELPLKLIDEIYFVDVSKVEIESIINKNFKLIF
tara:strand:- start:394 stop:495 length:102 start_codon:yes stop_codon:yes gene_type:complete